jgi:hypothetical protein
MAETKLSKNTFDQNRVYAAVQVELVQCCIRVGYLNSFQERASGADYFNRDILGSAYHKMKTYTG